MNFNKIAVILIVGLVVVLFVTQRLNHKPHHVIEPSMHPAVPASPQIQKQSKITQLSHVNPENLLPTRTNVTPKKIPPAIKEALEQEIRKWEIKNAEPLIKYNQESKNSAGPYVNTALFLPALNEDVWNQISNKYILELGHQKEYQNIDSVHLRSQMDSFLADRKMPSCLLVELSKEKDFPDSLSITLLDNRDGVSIDPATGGLQIRSKGSRTDRIDTPRYSHLFKIEGQQ